MSQQLQLLLLLLAEEKMALPTLPIPKELDSIGVWTM